MKKLCALVLLAGMHALAVEPPRNKTYVSAYDNVLAQVADGASWATRITLVNMGSVPASFNLYFYKGDGSAWNIELKDQAGAQSVWTFSIPVGGSLFLETPGTASEVTSGWAYLETAYWISGMATFRGFWLASNDMEAVVPFTSEIDNHYFIPFDNRAQYVTSMAILNPYGDRNANVTMQFRDPSGAVLKSDTFVLMPLEHQVFETTTRYPETYGKNGVIEVVATGPGGQFVSAPALALLFSPRNTVSTIPPVTILPVPF